jgi:hypothetical protein
VLQYRLGLPGALHGGLEILFGSEDEGVNAPGIFASFGGGSFQCGGFHGDGNDLVTKADRPR